MRVIIAGGGTGGHLFPAVAVGEALRRERPRIELLFVGSTAGLEARWMPQSGLRHELFQVHGLRGHTTGERLRAVAEFARAIAQALRLTRQFGPDVVLSAGGYASVPMAVAAIVMRKPLVLMEQNTRPGLANRMLWRFAKTICVGFDETAAFFTAAKTRVTGNPLRASFANSVSAERTSADIQILVLGGSSGAHRLNLAVLDAFKKMAKDVIKVEVIHQTGEADVGLVMAGYRDLGRADTKVLPFIDDVAQALAGADLVVSRSGAVTVAEVALAGRPAVFVPYPFHRDRQQELNARVIERIGGAVIVRDDEHLGDNLANIVTELISDRPKLEQMGARSRLAGRPDAAACVARVCLELGEERAGM
ncbi:MAG: undecaprenyldiphospho-muramoylpentapeptide beta-N-acetylglucosaminyltransferase [Candidatus Binataceae bacterium]